MKKYIVILFIALIGGAFIWSCSQDDLDNGQPIYHYSAEQLAEIRALAEEYDVPEVKYATASEKGLPTVEEMKETFLLFSMIKHSLTQTMETIDSSENHIRYRTKHPMFKRIYVEGEGYTGDAHIEESYNIDFESGNTYSCWLIIDVSWTNATDKNQNVKVEAKIEMDSGLAERVDVSNEQLSWQWIGATGLQIAYSCELRRKGSTSSKPYYKVTYFDVITIN